MKENKIKVGILGATGSVGQKFIEILSEHPYFEIAELGASERSAGKKYKDAVNWFQCSPLKEKVAETVVKECKADFESKLIFSGLDSSIAGEVEEEFAKKGYIVVSNSRNHRFDENVPLIVPEINPEHLELIKSQKYNGGAIITNPNCSTIGLAIALKPLLDKFGIESVNVTTLQALSGAGYPGVASLDIIDNVIPFIGGEEEKIETEPLKIFGNFENDKIKFADIKISAQCNRAPVIDGHLECVQVKLKRKTTKREIIDAWRTFKGEPQKYSCPMAPEFPIHYFENEKHPQPKLHRNLDKGMAVSAGRLRECSLFDYKFVIISHNTIRGAAGGAVLIAEILKQKNYIK